MFNYVKHAVEVKNVEEQISAIKLMEAKSEYKFTKYLEIDNFNEEFCYVCIDEDFEISLIRNPISNGYLSITYDEFLKYCSEVK